MRQAKAATKENQGPIGVSLFPDEATRSTVSGNKPVKGQAHLPRVGVRAARAVCHPGAVLFKTHHHDAVYVSEYRSASALRSTFIEDGGRSKQPLSTAPTRTEPGFPGEDCLSRKRHLSPEKQHQKTVRFAVDGGVHTCPLSLSDVAFVVAFVVGRSKSCRAGLLSSWETAPSHGKLQTFPRGAPIGKY